MNGKHRARLSWATLQGYLSMITSGRPILRLVIFLGVKAGNYHSRGHTGQVELAVVEKVHELLLNGPLQ